MFIKLIKVKVGIMLLIFRCNFYLICFEIVFWSVGVYGIECYGLIFIFKLDVVVIEII